MNFGFQLPMLASPLPDPFDFMPNEWYAEQKYDGERLIVMVLEGPAMATSLLDPQLGATKTVRAWSRAGIERTLPDHLVKDLLKFPPCILDNELVVPGFRSYGVKQLDNRQDLSLMVFDILYIEGMGELFDKAYVARRMYLETAFRAANLDYNLTRIRKSLAIPLENHDHLVQIRDEVYRGGGEGLILKHRDSKYLLGKRSKQWFKIKQLQSARLQVTGFQASRGKKNNRGPFAMIKLRDAEGHETVVKTRNDAMCREAEKRWWARPIGIGIDPNQHHPWINRWCLIEFQERTPDGSYRHPRFDRWVEEGEGG